MTDKDMLERAARAAGIEVIRSRLDDPLNRDMLIKNSARNPHQRNGPWNPLTDDGDALRLAVKLKIDIRYSEDYGDLQVITYGNETVFYPVGCDILESTRRAITRAAAAMAK